MGGLFRQCLQLGYCFAPTVPPAPAAINVTYVFHHDDFFYFRVDITPGDNRENVMYQVMIGTEVTTNSQASFVTLIQKESIDNGANYLNVNVTVINSCEQQSPPLQLTIPNPMTSEPS